MYSVKTGLLILISIHDFSELSMLTNGMIKNCDILANTLLNVRSCEKQVTVREFEILEEHGGDFKFRISRKLSDKFSSTLGRKRTIPYYVDRGPPERWVALE